jgi:predicted nuclease of predicted toxin-antitoxin system
MRIKLDENLSAKLKDALVSLGHDVDTTQDEALSGKPDDAVWEAAQAAARFFVTMDLDFSDARRYAPGTHAGVLVVRLPEAEQFRASDYVAAWFERHDTLAWARCLVVGTPARLRVRRPLDG